MNIIYTREMLSKEYVATKHGSTDLFQAIEQMTILCGQEITAYQKEGKRATIEAGNWDGYLVFRVVGNGKVYKIYAIKK